MTATSLVPFLAGALEATLFAIAIFKTDSLRCHPAPCSTCIGVFQAQVNVKESWCPGDLGEGCHQRQCGEPKWRDDTNIFLASSTTKKSFEFRKRLWHEPPDLDYRYLKIYKLVQEELKAMGGKDLEWRSNVYGFLNRDLFAQSLSKRICGVCIWRGGSSKMEKTFYEGLN